MRRAALWLLTAALLAAAVVFILGRRHSDWVGRDEKAARACAMKFVAAERWDSGPITSATDRETRWLFELGQRPYPPMKGPRAVFVDKPDCHVTWAPRD